MPQSQDEINIVIKRKTGDKITEACELMQLVDDRPCHRYYAVDRGIELLIIKLKRDLDIK